MSAEFSLPATISYGLSPRRRRIIYGVLGVMLALPVILALSDPKAGPAVGIIILLTMSPAMAILAFCAWYPRLTANSEGIRIRGALGFSAVFVPWSNLERFRMKANGEGLITREPLTCRAAEKWKNWSGLRYAGAEFFDAEQQMYIQQQRFVPLQTFAYWLRHGTLLEQIGRYAPALVADFEKQEPVYEDGKARERRKLMWVFAISAVLCVIAGVFGWLDSRATPAQHAVLNHGATIFNGFAAWTTGIALACYSLVNLRAAWRFARRKQFGVAALWLLMATIQLSFLLTILFSSK